MLLKIYNFINNLKKKHLCNKIFLMFIYEINKIYEVIKKKKKYKLSF